MSCIPESPACLLGCSGFRQHFLHLSLARKLLQALSPPNVVNSDLQIGVIYGNPEITSGGNALKFYSSVRLEVRRKETIKGSDGLDVGIRVKAKVRRPPRVPLFVSTACIRGINGTTALQVSEVQLLMA